MAATIDRRLSEKIRAAGESGRVEAIIVVKELVAISWATQIGEQEIASPLTEYVWDKLRTLSSRETTLRAEPSFAPLRTQSGRSLEHMTVQIKEGDPSLTPDDGGLARRVIEDAAERADERPFSVRYFPRANAAVITSGVRLVQEILRDERLAVASATEVDVIVFV